ncbi:MAG: pitrilysin family protein, partial [Myxococcota bacterium]
MELHSLSASSITPLAAMVICACAGPTSPSAGAAGQVAAPKTSDAEIKAELADKLDDIRPTTDRRRAFLAQRLPLDPAVRTGVLPNGLTYYIRRHREPEKRALLWLGVNAGSLQEDDDQRGLAHFVEHMAFNGTQRFAKAAIVNYLESIGMKFGPDVNAYTSFDETVYQLQLPTDDDAVVTRGFEILREWASAVAFEPEEVDKERGVVLEEWRRGRGAFRRIVDKQYPVLFKGSKYAERLPIGRAEIIEKAPVEALVRYYRDWYRPDLMA